MLSSFLVLVVMLSHVDARLGVEPKFMNQGSASKSSKITIIYSFYSILIWIPGSIKIAMEEVLLLLLRKKQTNKYMDKVACIQVRCTPP